MGVLRVDRNADNGGVTLPEVRYPVMEGEQFGGADKGEIQRVEKEHRVSVTNHVLQPEGVFDRSVRKHGGGGKVRCRGIDQIHGGLRR